MRNKIIPYGRNLKQFARKLRNNSTRSEILLWKRIRKKALGVQFHRQVPIGGFIVDFYCHELKLAIEIDGSSHDDQLHKDQYRQHKLEKYGIKFLRFPDQTVKRSISNVVWAIIDTIQEMQPDQSAQ